MNPLRGFLSFILGAVLLILIIALSLVFRVKSFVEEDVAITLLKAAVISELDDEDISKEQKDILEKIINDKEAETIVKRFVQNFLSYETTDDYNLSKDDYDLVINFILKYQDDLNTLGETDYSEEQIKEELSYEELNDAVKEAFGSIGSDNESEDVRQVLEVYSKITSEKIKLILLIAIAICIGLMMIVKWSVITWLKPVGVDFILSGLFFAGIYLAIRGIMNKLIAEQEAVEIIKSINFNGFLITAIIEIAIGAIMIASYKSILKTNSNTGIETKRRINGIQKVQ